jgi:flavorubredoxin
VHQGLKVQNRMKINYILVSHMKSGKSNSVTTTTQAASHQLHTAAAWVQFQVRLCGNLW